MKKGDTLDIPQDLKKSIERMLSRTQTKMLFPVITLGLVQSFLRKRRGIFTDLEVRRSYEQAVQDMKRYLGHNLHIGGEYYDAYPSRNMPKYGVIRVLGNKRYRLQPLYQRYARQLARWLPEVIKMSIAERIGVVADLANHGTRSAISSDAEKFIAVVREHIDGNPVNFEIFGFALIKVHLEKFACKVYRDTRTSAHDAGVDLSTNFGVVYQIKKLRVTNLDAAKNIYNELRANFDRDRLDEGNVILIIDDITSEVKKYLIDMKVQSIDKQDLLNLAYQFRDVEDREKVLRIVYEEFRREYGSVI